MIVDLTSVAGSASYEFEISPEEIDLDTSGISLPEKIDVKCVIRRNLVETDVSGEIRTRAEVDCTRCLQPVPVDLDIRFEVSYVAPEAFSTDKELEVPESDLGRDVLESESLDLKEVAREQILLNLPDRAFCREACKGLCPKCGTNLNLNGCGCSEDEIDPRWSALRNFK
jgi:uncharacterized protein